MHILVLEDDPTLRFALMQFLEEIGYVPHAAADIPEAVKLLNKTTFDFLLMDLMIGLSESLQIADLAGYRCPNAEIIYMTGSNKYPNGELFHFAKNVSWVLRKPIDFHALKAMLAHVEGAMLKSTSQRTVALNPVADIFFNRQ